MTPPQAPAYQGTTGDPKAQPLIEVRDLCFGYRRREHIVDHVSLSIHRGDYLAIIGPNGGGKTTLLKLMLGLLKPRSGKVIHHLPGGIQSIGYVPQFSGFDRDFPLRVSEVVRMGTLGRLGALRPYGARERRDVDTVLRTLQLQHLADNRIGELSGGQLQRVLIARAIVAEPALLFLDEPTASIDQDSRGVLSRLLQDLNRRIPVVIVTHDITALAPAVKQVACVNRSLYYHPSGELTEPMLEEVYGCPVDLIAHGVPHRVLAEHKGGKCEHTH
jgi:zinc transport system ATP-binding protein